MNASTGTNLDQLSPADLRSELRAIRGRNRKLRRQNARLRMDVRGPSEVWKTAVGVAMTLGVGVLLGIMGVFIANWASQRAERDRQLAGVLVQSLGSKRETLKTFGDKFPGSVYRAYLYRHRLAWLNSKTTEDTLQGLPYAEVRSQYSDRVVPDYLQQPNIVMLVATARVEFPENIELESLQRKCVELVEASTTEDAQRLVAEINRIYDATYEQMLRATRAYEAGTLRQFGYGVREEPTVPQPSPTPRPPASAERSDAAPAAGGAASGK
jgi:hypothetical protein